MNTEEINSEIYAEKERADKKSGGKQEVSSVVIKRLPRYYRYLRELLNVNILRISSNELSQLMHVTASQIRQDLNCFGGFGQQGYGYNVKYLYGKIGEILGVNRNFTAVIIGTGNLGRALASSPIFQRRGVNLTALFDVNPLVIGSTVSGYTVLNMDTLESYIAKNHTDIAVLTLPKEAVCKTAERLAELGIHGLWNFASREIELLNPNVIIENVHMGDSLMTLTYELTRLSDTEKEVAP